MGSEWRAEGLERQNGRIWVAKGKSLHKTEIKDNVTVHSSFYGVHLIKKQQLDNIVNVLPHQLISSRNGARFSTLYNAVVSRTTRAMKHFFFKMAFCFCWWFAHTFICISKLTSNYFKDQIENCLAWTLNLELVPQKPHFHCICRYKHQMTPFQSLCMRKNKLSNF